LIPLALDENRSGKRPSGFDRSRRAEVRYSAALKRAARAIGSIVTTVWHPDDQSSVGRVISVLNHYGRLIEPWAEAVARGMIEDVAHRDKRAWFEAADKMGRQLRQEINDTPVGHVMRQRLEDQIVLIRSLPIEAAERVRHLTNESLTNASRSSEIANEIMRSGEVARSRAELIARTETARTATELTKARAENIGSTAYIWRTAHDGDVRPSHKKMDGQVVRWDDPPTLDGLTGHAGCLPNCRCFPEPIVPED
jgi:SPP1 gp7 family putative phage head morphogenesis protein